jgi:hypothetical protein
VPRGNLWKALTRDVAINRTVQAGEIATSQGSSGVGNIQRYSGPFDGPSGMRGSAVLLGSLHITWDTDEATIYRVTSPTRAPRAASPSTGCATRCCASPT